MAHDDVWLLPEAVDKKNRQRVGFGGDRRVAYQAVNEATGEIIDYFEPMRDMVVELAKEIGIRPFHILANDVLPKRAEVARSLPAPQRPPPLSLGIQFNSGSLDKLDERAAYGLLDLTVTYRGELGEKEETEALSRRAAMSSAFLSSDEVAQVRLKISKYCRWAVGSSFDAAHGVRFGFTSFSRTSPPPSVCRGKKKPVRNFAFFLHWDLYLN